MRYNDVWILALGIYRGDTLYYRLTPKYSDNKSASNGITVETITKLRYDSLVSDCKDCKELDADKILALDYEQDHGRFSIMTILIISLLVIYLFYRIYNNINI